jgi:hypothetical protein
MKHQHLLTDMLPLALLLALVPTAFASTIWYVNGTNGSDSNNCKSLTTPCKTIGHAISLASSGDSIMVAAATYKENVGIAISLTITGSAAQTTIVDGGNVNTVVTVYGNAHVTLSNLTIRNGRAFSRGGGIYNYGTLTINDSTLSGNTASANCNGFCWALGGGIYNNGGSLTINNTTLSGNSASGGCQFTCGGARGGGIYNDGSLTINNTTLSGNTASAHCGGACGAYGGGIDNGLFNNGALKINNSTVSGNSARNGGGGIHNGNANVATLQNSIVANSPSGGNCGGSITSNGYNMSSDSSCNFSNSGDRNNTDPMLGPLQNNGGPTQTMALLPGSVAIDAGNPSGCKDASGHLLTTDQRGMPRHDPEDTGGCDMGAYERQTD